MTSAPTLQPEFIRPGGRSQIRGDAGVLKRNREVVRLLCSRRSASSVRNVLAGDPANLVPEALFRSGEGRSLERDAFECHGEIDLFSEHCAASDATGKINAIRSITSFSRTTNGEGNRDLNEERSEGVDGSSFSQTGKVRLMSFKTLESSRKLWHSSPFESDCLPCESVFL